MNKNNNAKFKNQCGYCFEGKCYANAALSPEEYDSNIPKCINCKMMNLVKTIR